MRHDEEIALRRVSGEACVLAAAARAILLQVAHPMVGRGVAEHSRFTEDPLKRLRGTLDYVYGSSFGTSDESAWIAATVNRVHKHVVGPGYSADDPELQLWVAATLYDSGVRIYELTLGPMPPAMQEEYCRESGRYATQLGCPQDMWPSSVAEFDEYWQRQVDTLEISDDAKRIYRDLMYSRALPWYLRALLPTNRLITAGLLPERIREQYGLAWSPRRERAFRLAMRLTRLTYPWVPRRIRQLPMTFYMRDFRRRYRAYVLSASA
ncbi:oxygenase MpaB family protein [Catenulispora subtropica]|uniref:oxygenase MpaB family protein n=1 Tax=Catenulispora subtropica TaxID=450798 RepID=UPI0031D89696